MKLDIRPHMHRSYVSSKTILSEYQKGKLIQLFKRHVLDMRGILGRLYCYYRLQILTLTAIVYDLEWMGILHLCPLCLILSGILYRCAFCNLRTYTSIEVGCFEAGDSFIYPEYVDLFSDFNNFLNAVFYYYLSCDD